MSTINVNAGTHVEPGSRAHSGTTDEKEKVSATVPFDVGDSLAEAVEMYGEDIVFERWKRQAKRDLGNAIRSSLNNGKTPEEVEEDLSDWRPDVSRRGAAQEKDIVDQFQELDEEERREKLEKLMAIAEG